MCGPKPNYTTLRQKLIDSSHSFSKNSMAGAGSSEFNPESVISYKFPEVMLIVFYSLPSQICFNFVINLCVLLSADFIYLY